MRAFLRYAVGPLGSGLTPEVLAAPPRIEDLVPPGMLLPQSAPPTIAQAAPTAAPTPGPQGLVIGRVGGLVGGNRILLRAVTVDDLGRRHRLLALTIETEDRRELGRVVLGAGSFTTFARRLLAVARVMGVTATPAEIAAGVDEVRDVPPPWRGASAQAARVEREGDDARRPAPTPRAQRPPDPEPVAVGRRGAPPASFLRAQRGGPR